MPLKYRLECECGDPHAVAAQHAGDSISCACGRTLQVPHLRGLKALPEIADESPVQASSRWTLGHGLLFALAVPVFLAGAIVGGRSLWLSRQYEVPAPTLQQVLDLHQDPITQTNFETLTLMDAYENVWKKLEAIPDLTRMPPPHLVAKQRWGILRWQAVAFGGAGTLGISGHRRRVGQRIASRRLITLRAAELPIAHAPSYR